MTMASNVLSTADASALVRIGETMAIAAIRAEVAEPELLAPNDGFVVTNVTLCSGCAVSVRAGPPTDRAQMLTQQVSNLLLSLNVIALNSLVIQHGKLVWCLHIDSFVISDAGNAFDAAWTSILSALRNLKLPTVYLDMETLSARADPSIMTPFPFPKSIRLPVSFRWLSSKAQLVADPTDTEESVLCDYATVIVASEDLQKILFVESLGVPLDVIPRAISSSHIQKYLEQLRMSLS